MKRSEIASLMLIAAAVIAVVGALAIRHRRTTPSASPIPGYRVLPAPVAAAAIEGRVVLGTSGALAAAKIARDPCFTASVPVAGSGLAETVVRLDGVHEGVRPALPAPVVRLGSCGFEPRVAVGLEGSSVDVKAPAGHRIQAFLDSVRLFDASAEGNARVTLVGPGVWTVRCASGHPGERAWIYAADHPYVVVTAADGSFRIDEVPLGHYTLVAWNPELGERRAEADAGTTGLLIRY